MPSNPLIESRPLRHSIRLVPLAVDVAHRFVPFLYSATTGVGLTTANEPRGGRLSGVSSPDNR